MKPILFSDLDGTLIGTTMGNAFPQGIWDMSLRLYVFDAIKRLDPEVILIVSNQGSSRQRLTISVRRLKTIAEFLVILCIVKATTSKIYTGNQIP